MFRELGFNTLLTDMIATAKTEETDYRLVNTIDKFNEFLDRLKNKRYLLLI